jgi:hypothetical protein
MNEIDSNKFADLLRATFPEIETEITEWTGLAHLQMMEFLVFTERAAEANDWTTVNKCLVFADELVHNGNSEIRNAVHVSYLEHLPREGEAREKIWEMMTPELRTSWINILEYLKRLD